MSGGLRFSVTGYPHDLKSAINALWRTDELTVTGRLRVLVLMRMWAAPASQPTATAFTESFGISTLDCHHDQYLECKRRPSSPTSIRPNGHGMVFQPAAQVTR